MSFKVGDPQFNPNGSVSVGVEVTLLRNLGHLTQPKGSFTCGQHCIAILAGCSLGSAVFLTGRKGKTNTKDLRRALHHLGYSLPSTKLTRKPLNCKVAILRLKVPNGHWALYVEGWVYDPSADYPMEYHEYLHIVKSAGAKITSHLEIEK